MNKGWRECWRWTAGFAPALALAGAAAAAQPPGTSAFNEFRGAARDNGGSRAAPLSRLDLRAPTGLAQFSEKLTAPTGGGEEFPSARQPETDAPVGRLDAHLLEAHLEATSLEERSSLAREGLAMARPMSRVQEMARRFQREGLPVARLFENRSALVSLGLNQHGKPGIWLIQKLP